MKKIITLILVLAGIALIQSCTTSQKHCAAYAKHDTGNQPTYHEVQ